MFQVAGIELIIFKIQQFEVDAHENPVWRKMHFK